MKKYYDLVVEEFGGELDITLRGTFKHQVVIEGRCKQEILHMVADELAIIDWNDDEAKLTLAASYDIDSGIIELPCFGNVCTKELEEAA